jgi:hypothetical protein
MKLSSRSKLSGEGLLPVVLVVLLIILGLGWYLYSTKAATERETKRYGHEVIDRLVVKHDRAMLEQDLTAQAKMQMPPSGRDYILQRLAQFGAPQQPIEIEDNVSFDQSSFFGLISAKPRGSFTAHLNYPGQPCTLQVAVSQGETRWLIEDVTFTLGAPPH